MTEEEVRPYVGKAVRATIADGRTIAGTLYAGDDHGHGHVHYAIVSDPVREGGEPVEEMFHGSTAFTELLDASNDPAATL